MALVRWEPVRELSSLQQDMNRIFNGFFDGQAPQTSRWLPPMDLIETREHFVLRADLPGVTEQDVKIELDNNLLEISGERRFEQREDEQGSYRLERAQGHFSRSLTLPEGVDEEGISASFDRGVLTVQIPKPPQRRPRRVEIGVNGSQASESSGA